MRQISLGINQSCCNRLRVQIIPQLYNILFNPLSTKAKKGYIHLTEFHCFPPELELVELEQVRLLGFVSQGSEHSPLLRPRLARQADGFLQQDVSSENMQQMAVSIRRC
jgi:hypothetical protein